MDTNAKCSKIYAYICYCKKWRGTILEEVGSLAHCCRGKCTSSIVSLLWLHATAEKIVVVAQMDH